MASIEQRIEATAYLPDYSGLELTPEEIAQGAHKSYVGGVWDTHGLHQLEFLQSRGMRPQDALLDVGCGALRAGRHIVDFLQPGNYYGVDANLSVMQAGYDVELNDEQRGRLPVRNLRANDRFDVDFGVQVDIALAQSVFTHVSLNHIRLCLYRVAKVMRPGGVFYATFFERANKTPVDHIFGVDRRKPLFTEQNVFWYYRPDLRWAASFSPWKFEYIGDWGHPAGQKMVKYTRLSEEAWAEAKAKPARQARKKSPRANAATSQPSAREASRLGQKTRRVLRGGRQWAARRIDPN